MNVVKFANALSTARNDASFTFYEGETTSFAMGYQAGYDERKAELAATPPAPPATFRNNTEMTKAILAVQDQMKRADRNESGCGKISAIREFRNVTGWGLKESKDFVESVDWYIFT